jgi:AraC-like DNA-binding protein
MDRDLLHRLDRSREYLAASLAAPVRLEEAARQACLSPYHYHRLYCRTFGETPQEFLTRLRMERARGLLASTDLPVTDVCFAIGYSSLGTFSSRFRQTVGRSPIQYRREARHFFRMWPLYPRTYVPCCFLRRFVGPRPLFLPEPGGFIPSLAPTPNA